MSNKKKIYFYTQVIPAETGSGASVRVFTNLRAYLDLGYSVELILFLEDLNKNIELNKPLKLIEIKKIQISSNNYKFFEKLAFHIGFPKESILNHLFPVRRIVKKEIEKRLAENNSDIHHFEYLNIASSIVGLDGNFIWSNHDLNPERYLSIQRIRNKIKKRHSFFSKHLKYFQLRRSEKWIANNSKIMLNISELETNIYQKRIKNVNSKLLPFSWPEEKFLSQNKVWTNDGKLRMLHVGSLNSMVPFSSLDFIIRKLFKIIPKEMLKKIELIVAGNNPNATFSNYIKKLASDYENIYFLGYVENLDSLFMDTDIQIVCSQFSSGLRTRIVESFVRGLPVLSTVSASNGLYGLENWKNILIGKNELEIMKIITDLLADKSPLENIAICAKKLYVEKYSRKIHSKKLNNYINFYT